MTAPHPTPEAVLCSKAQLRILKLLMESQPLTASEIATKLEVNFVSARANLDALEEADVLTHANFGKTIRYYTFKGSAKANAIRDLIEAWTKVLRTPDEP
jgi:predicted ArsR family transcriptional regulator